MVWKEQKPILESRIQHHRSFLRNVSISIRSTGIFRILIFTSHNWKEYSSTKEIKIFSNKLIQLQKRKLLWLLTNGTWKESNTTGLPDTVNFQEAFISQRASTQLAIWISETVFSKDFITTSTEKLLLPTSSPLHQLTPIGSLVTTESPTSNMNTEICD